MRRSAEVYFNDTFAGVLSQEDFCQLMNISKETHGDDYKYQFSYESIANIIKRYCVASIVELEKFFKLILFNSGKR